MRKKILSVLFLGIISFTSSAFSRSAEWNLNRYEAHYVKIKEALDKGELDNGKKAANELLAMAKQVEHGTNSDVDTDLLKLTSQRISRSKNLEQANQELGKLTKIIERWRNQK